MWVKSGDEAYKINVDPYCEWKKSQNSRNRSEQNWTKPRFSSVYNGLYDKVKRQVRPFGNGMFNFVSLNNYIDIIEKNNCVIYHHTCKRNDANHRHDNDEIHLEDNKAQQDSYE